jgi:hypothetical protein
VNASSFLLATTGRAFTFPLFFFGDKNRQRKKSSTAIPHAKKLAENIKNAVYYRFSYYFEAFLLKRSVIFEKVLQTANY